MEITIESKRYNPLLKRTELRIRVTHENEPTPKREDLRNLIASEFGVEVNRVIVHYIKSEFGRGVSRCYAKIYDTIEDALKLEREYILRRNGLIKEGEESAAGKS